MDRGDQRLQGDLSRTVTWTKYYFLLKCVYYKIQNTAGYLLDWQTYSFKTSGNRALCFTVEEFVSSPALKTEDHTVASSIPSLSQ